MHEVFYRLTYKKSPLSFTTHTCKIKSEEARRFIEKVLNKRKDNSKWKISRVESVTRLIGTITTLQA